MFGQAYGSVVEESLLVNAVPPALLSVSRTSKLVRQRGILLQLTSFTQFGTSWTFTVRVPALAFTLKKSTSVAEVMRPRRVVPLVSVAALLVALLL